MKKLRQFFSIKTTLWTAWRLLWDKRMPRKNKLLFLGLSIGYLLLPSDLFPDYFLLFGLVDDLAVITLLLKGFIRSAPQILRSHQSPPR